MRQKDPAVTASRPLAFFCYSFSDASDEFVAPTNHYDVMQLLQSWGCRVNKKLTRVKGFQACLDVITELSESRDTLGYEIDGAVIKIDSFGYREFIGDTAHHPRWAIAYKYPPQEKVTILTAVDFQVGRTGTLTPVARLAPVIVGGVAVSNATLHNMEQVEQLDLKIGDLVRIRRAGDVVPQVMRVEEGTRNPEGVLTPIEKPSTCPECGTQIKQRTDFVDLKCTAGRACAAQLNYVIEHFASKSALDIDGLGTETIRQLCESGKVKAFSDLFRLTAEDFAALPKFGPKRTENALQSIANAKQTTFQRLLVGLGIETVGPEVAAEIGSKVTTVDELIARVHRPRVSEPPNEIIPDALFDAISITRKQLNASKSATSRLAVKGAYRLWSRKGDFSYRLGRTNPSIEWQNIASAALDSIEFVLAGEEMEAFQSEAEVITRDSMLCIWYSAQCYIVARVLRVELAESNCHMSLGCLFSHNPNGISNLADLEDQTVTLKLSYPPSSSRGVTWWFKSDSDSIDSLPPLEMPPQTPAGGGWMPSQTSLGADATGIYLWRADWLEERWFGPYLWSESIPPALDLTERIADEVGSYFSEPSNVSDVQELVRLGVDWSTEVAEAVDQSLEGETWVITGKFEGLKRDDLKAWLISRGAKVGSSVSKNTSFVVAGENAGSKRTKALELGVPVLTETELRERLGLQEDAELD